MKSFSFLIEELVGHDCELLCCGFLRPVGELTANFDGQALQNLLLDEVVDRDLPDSLEYV